MSGMIDRVLRGEHPGEIPVARVSQPELVVNFAVAREMGISIPSGFAERATHLIQ
jgi:putative ABC transport system substrate-binding protein